MPARIFITGIGAISSIGKNVEQILESLKTGKHGITFPEIIKTRHHHFPCGEIKTENNELAGFAGINTAERFFTRGTLLGTIAAREAIEMSGINPSDSRKTALISATTVGGMSAGEDFFLDFLSGSANQSIVKSFDCGDSTEAISEISGFTEYTSTISTACSSSANSIAVAARLIKIGKVDRAIAGGTDPLSRFTINGFKSLEILDTAPCRPFDESRSGLNIGEGAAYLVLESEKTADPSRIICEFKGFGIANDAWHQTASSPEGYGAVRAMKDALASASLKPGDIGYINAHGTATLINDVSEGLAVQKVFGDKIPFISSTKAYTGHTLGAAGALEAVISILAIRHKLVFPNLRFSEQMKELSFMPVKDNLTGMEINHVMSNSFGFGGNNTSLVFSRYIS